MLWNCSPIIYFWIFNVSHYPVLESYDQVSNVIMDSLNAFYFTFIWLKNLKLKSKQDVPKNENHHEGKHCSDDFSNQLSLESVIFIDFNQM